MACGWIWIYLTARCGDPKCNTSAAVVTDKIFPFTGFTDEVTAAVRDWSSEILL